MTREFFTTERAAYALGFTVEALLSMIVRGIIPRPGTEDSDGRLLWTRDEIHAATGPIAAELKRLRRLREKVLPIRPATINRG